MIKKPEKDKLVIFIERWLKKPDSSAVKLASELGYSSSNAIYNWVYRGKVPKHARDAVKGFFQKEGRSS